MKANKIRKSVAASFWDGIFASAMQGLVADYLTPYALWLKATVSQIGYLSAIPGLISSIAQLQAPDFTERVKSRRTVIVSCVYVQALALLPMMLIPVFFHTHGATALIVFVTVFSVFSAIATPAWASLIAEYIPHGKRGAYFSWRAKVMNCVTIVFSLLSGLILFLLKNDQQLAFGIILAAAFISRLFSWYFLNKMHEPVFNASREHHFSFYRFLARFRESNYAKFVVFIACFHFSVNFASPFFSVFMLRDLRFNYLTYTILIAAVTATHIIMIDRWGKFADKVGNVRVIRFTAFFIAGLPLLWIINRHPVYLFFAQVVSGFAWSGFNLCVSNFIYDAVTPGKRTRCIAYFNMCAGIAVFLGAISGGYAAGVVPSLCGYKLLSLFLIASILRYTVAGFLLPQIREVRLTIRVSSKELFYSVLGFNAMGEKEQ